MKCPYIYECKYYDYESEVCNDYSNPERHYCGQYRRKRDIEDRFKLNRKIIG